MPYKHRLLIVASFGSVLAAAVLAWPDASLPLSRGFALALLAGIGIAWRLRSRNAQPPVALELGSVAASVSAAPAPVASAPVRQRAEAGRVVVVGGAGYIGSVLVRKLLEAGHETTVLDRLDYGEESLAELFDDPRFRLVRADMRDADTLSAVVRGAGAVIHLGAIVGDAACDAEPEEAISINYQGAAAVGRAARAAGVERMLFASTCSVYGSASEFVDETSRLNPVSLYATTKIDAENLLLSWCDERFRPTALRIGTAFGWSPRPRFDLAINLLSARAAFEKQASIYNSSRWRPFVHVDDIARGFVAVLEAPLEQVGGQIFNLGSTAMNRRLADVGEALCRLYPDADVRYEPTDDRRDYRVSFAKIERTLGFHALKSLEDGMLEIAAKIHGGAVENYRAQKYHNHRLDSAVGGEVAKPPAVWPGRRDPDRAPLIQGIGA